MDNSTAPGAKTVFSTRTGLLLIALALVTSASVYPRILEAATMALPEVAIEDDFAIVRCQPERMAPELIFFHTLEGRRWYWLNNKCGLEHSINVHGHTNVARPYRGGIVAIVDRKPVDYDTAGHNKLDSDTVFERLPVELHHDVFLTSRGTYLGIG